MRAAPPPTASSVGPAMTVSSSNSSGSTRSAEEQDDRLRITDHDANRRSRWSMTEAELPSSSSLYNLASAAGRSMPDNIHDEDSLGARHTNDSRRPDQPPLPHITTHDLSQQASGSTVSALRHSSVRTGLTLFRSSPRPRLCRLLHHRTTSLQSWDMSPSASRP